MRWLVSGNIGPFKQGDVLVSKEKIGEYFRTGLSEGRAPVSATMLSDDAIAEIINKHYPDPEQVPTNYDHVSDAEIEMDEDFQNAMIHPQTAA